MNGFPTSAAEATHCQTAMTDSIPRLSRAAERMRRHRERRRDGLRCVMVELRETEIDELIRRKLLKSETRNDAWAIKSAIYAIFDDVLG
jgi:hypothetical protein